VSSVILDTVTRAAFQTVLVFSVYLLFAGHNAPGGGFVGGLVAGAALVLRYVSGGETSLAEVLPVAPEALLGAGLLTAGLTGVGSLLAGGPFLESAKLEAEVAVLGHVEVTSALAFDTGVYLVVIGLVTGLLATVGRAEGRVSS
jgi:multicomponent Na+:H+ antiporter subunit A